MSDTADDSSPTPSRARATLTRHKVAATVTALAVIAGLAVARTAIGQTGGQTERTQQAVAEPEVLASADGALKVGATDVEQMKGRCDGSSCYHVPPSTPVTITAKQTSKLDLKAGQSRAFTIGAYNLDKTTQPVPLTIEDGKLAVGKTNPGTYSVTVAGQPNGGMWQFTLKVTKK